MKLPVASGNENTRATQRKAKKEKLRLGEAQLKLARSLQLASAERSAAARQPPPKLLEAQLQGLDSNHPEASSDSLNGYGSK